MFLNPRVSLITLGNFRYEILSSDYTHLRKPHFENIPLTMRLVHTISLPTVFCFPVMDIAIKFKTFSIIVFETNKHAVYLCIQLISNNVLIQFQTCYFTQCIRKMYKNCFSYGGKVQFAIFKILFLIERRTLIAINLIFSAF